MMMRSTSAALALAVTLLVTACGDDEQRPGGPVAPGTTHNTTPTTNTPPPTFEDSAQITIAITPQRAVHRTGATVTLAARVLDEAGVVIPNVPLTWEVSPASAATRGDGEQWQLTAQGQVRWRVCVEGLPQVCADAGVLVDDAPPTLTLTSPTPGEVIDGSQRATITVAGRAEDSHGELVAFVNGLPVALDAAGEFTIELTPSFGVNHILASVTDGTSRAITTASMDVLWAPAFFAPDPSQDEAAIEVEDALLLRLGQTFMDDRRQPAVTPEGATLTEDLADILTVLLRHIDLGSAIPNPVIDSTDIQLSVDDFRIGTPVLRLDLVEGGLELYLQGSDLSVDTSGQLTLIDRTLNLTGTIDASIAVLARISITKASGDAPFEVEVTSLDVAIEGADSRFLDPQADAIFTLAQSALRFQIEAYLIEALQGSFIDAIPDLLRDALTSLQTALEGQVIPLDLGLGAPLDLSFSGQIDSFNVTPYSDALATISARLAATAPVTRDSIGVPMQQPYVAHSAPFFEGSRIQIALRLVALNGLLYNLWRAGLLEIDATTLLPDNLSSLIQRADLSGKLAPLLRPPARGEPYDMILELGQLELEADFGADQVTYGVNLRAGVTAGVVDGALKIEIAPTPEIITWQIASNTERPLLTADTLRTLLLTQLWPQLTEALGDGLSLSLPVLDLDGLSTYAPALSSFTLSFTQARPVLLRDGYILVDSNLRGALPAAP